MELHTQVLLRQPGTQKIMGLGQTGETLCLVLLPATLRKTGETNGNCMLNEGTVFGIKLTPSANNSHSRWN